MIDISFKKRENDWWFFTLLPIIILFLIIIVGLFFNFYSYSMADLFVIFSRQLFFFSFILCCSDINLKIKSAKQVGKPQQLCGSFTVILVSLIILIFMLKIDIPIEQFSLKYLLTLIVSSGFACWAVWLYNQNPSSAGPIAIIEGKTDDEKETEEKLKTKKPSSGTGIPYG